MTVDTGTMKASRTPFARCLIYAAGGGMGHRVRGETLARLLAEIGITSELVFRDGQSTSGFAISADESLAAEWLIVDTFPRGWRGELTPEILSRYRRRTLLARYSREPDWGYVEAHYDDIAYPYPERESEWGTPPRPGRCLGYLLRHDRLVIADSRGSTRFLILDPERRCSSHVREILYRTAFEAGLEPDYRSRLDGHERTALGGVDAKKTLVIGAGYNTFYELLLGTADVRFLPINKRFDDQLRRCEAKRAAVRHLPDLADWLGERQVPHDRVDAGSLCDARTLASFASTSDRVRSYLPVTS